MKTPVVDYRTFRLRKLNDPQFSHLKYLFGWVGYFLLYFLTENLIPAENCTSIHIPLDDCIPFHELYVIPYTFWYLLIVVSLLYFALYNTDSFKKLQTYIIVTQVLAMVVYIVYPSRQDLRPEVFPRENFFTWILGLLYTFDTNTGVCPSLHCAYSIGIASVWLKRRETGGWLKAFMVFAAVMVCLSTMFVKQHSAVDFFAAIPVCILAEYLVFHGPWRNKKHDEGADP